MNYEGQICRAPMERASYMLPVMVGCSYNRCKFCNLFRHLKYRVLPLEQVEEELCRVKKLGGKPGKIFLGDGNAFGLSSQYLMKLLDLIRGYFPECRQINMDATVTSILKKSDEELRVLASRGVCQLYLGIESGLDDVLAFMDKDHNLEQGYEAIRRIQSVGMIYNAHIMTGVAGRGRGVENAEALADFLNQTQPRNVVNFSMFLHKETPLYQEIEKGSFIPADELENLQEERRLLELLAKDMTEEMLYDGFHDYIQVRIRGCLLRDREMMLEKLDGVIAKYTNQQAMYAYVQGECPDLEKCEKSEKVWGNGQD